jgi:aspartate/methionine/tyrosine aminotransferase
LTYTSPIDRFAPLGIDSAPGERAPSPTVTGVDFSHGDVDAFPPAPGAFAAVAAAYDAGSSQAYSRYRGHLAIREPLAGRIAEFTGAPVHPGREVIIVPGTQAGLFLAMSALVEPSDKVAVIEPDYFANRKIVSYLGGQIVPVPLSYENRDAPAELDFDQLNVAVKAGAKVILLSNPNNPTGVVYPERQIRGIVDLAERFGAFVVVDQLYARLIYPGHTLTHLRACGISTDRCLTLLGPSKTESLSGFRIGVAVGAPDVIGRMEQLLAIVSLRTAGYNQSALDSWFTEPDGWLDDRITAHQRIRDDLVRILSAADGFGVRPPEGGSYIFPRLPELIAAPTRFVDSLRERAGIIVTPGTEFSSQHGTSIRLNFSQDHDRAVRAVRTIVDMAKELAR